MCHLLSFLVLLYKMITSRTVAGVSLKTQQLYVLVFLCRYLDIFWDHHSLYNTVMKVLFVFFSLTIVYMMMLVCKECFIS